MKLLNELGDITDWFIEITTTTYKPENTPMDKPINREDRITRCTKIIEAIAEGGKTLSLSATSIETIGKALFGERWQTDLGRALGHSDGRRVRQWMNSERPVPLDLDVRLNTLLVDKNKDLMNAQNLISTKQSGPLNNFPDPLIKS